MWRSTFLCVVAFALAVAGCKRDDTTAPTDKTPPADPAPQASAAAGLAMATVAGEDPVARDLRTVQDRLRSFPKKTDYWILLGQHWVRHARRTADPGFYQNAQAAADEALSLAPDNRAALNLLGFVHLNAHRFDQARDMARRILKVDPDDPQALGTLSDAQLELGDVDGAVDATQKMLDRKPNLPSYARASYLAWLQNDRKQALYTIKQAYDSGRSAKDREPSAWVLTSSAEIFWHEGDLEGAAAGYEMALKEMPGYHAAQAGLGRVRVAQGRAAEGVKLLTAAWSAARLPLYAWWLGDAHAQAGDTAAADKAWGDVVRFGRVMDKKTLAAFYAAKNRKVEKALELADAELKTRGGVYLHDTRAWALYRLGRLDEARKASDEAMKLKTPDPVIRFHAAMIRIKTGDTEGGRALLSEVLTRTPKFDLAQAEEGKAVLKRAAGGASQVNSPDAGRTE